MPKDKLQEIRDLFRLTYKQAVFCMNYSGNASEAANAHVTQCNKKCPDYVRIILRPRPKPVRDLERFCEFAYI